MRRLTSALLATTSLVCAAPMASAADMPARAPVYKAPPAAVAAYNWTGFYLGGNIGYSWGKADTDAISDFTASICSEATLGCRFFDIPGAFSESLKPKGVIGGGQVGWNSQFGNWVFGLEADLQASGQKDDRSRSDPIAASFTFCAQDIEGGGCLIERDVDVSGTSETTLEARLKWFGTVRGRIGYTWDSLLIYGTGGLAYGKFNLSGVNTIAGIATCLAPCDIEGNAVLIPFSSTTALNSSKNKAGWTLGAGVEGAAFAPNWTWKVEYLYLDFGKFHHSFPTAEGGLIEASTRVTDHILRFGVNYRFGGGKGPVVARY